MDLTGSSEVLDGMLGRQRGALESGVVARVLGDGSDRGAEEPTEYAGSVYGRRAGFVLNNGVECIACLGDVAIDDLDVG